MVHKNPADKGRASKLEFAAMLCLYRDNSASDVRDALKSTFEKQSLPPAHLIVVFDGPVPADVEALIDEYECRIPTTRIVFRRNMGHGPARAAAIEACTYSWIAIVDADDISMPHRFEALASIIRSHPDAAVVGGALTEFHIEDGKMVIDSTAIYPVTPEGAARHIQGRTPVGQPTAMLRVAAILAVGNYQAWLNNEDYHLWIRLVKAGYHIRNHPDPVLLLRTDPDLYDRRGGMKYWWSEVSLQLYSLRRGTTTVPKFIFGVTVRFFVQVLLPNKARAVFYRRVLRRP